MDGCRLHSRTLALAAAAFLFAAGCGGGDERDANNAKPGTTPSAGAPPGGGGDEEGVRDAIRDVAAAIEDKDYERVCDRFTDEVRKRLESGAREAGGGTCAELLQRFDKGGAIADRIGKPEDLKFETVTVEGDTATVEIKDEREPTRLVKERGQWKLDVNQ